MLRRRTFLSIPAVLLAVRSGGAQDHPATEQYTPSDPALVGRTGRPQLVEFFHHL